MTIQQQIAQVELGLPVNNKQIWINLLIYQIKKFYRWNVVKDSGKRNKNGAEDGFGSNDKKEWQCKM